VRVLYIFTFGYSLETWNKSGTLQKELKIFRELSNKKGVSFTFLTYGDKSDLTFNLTEENIKVIPMFEKAKNKNKKFLVILSTLIFVYRNKEELKNFDLIKHNQLNGAWLAIFLKKLIKKPFFLRTGYDTYKFSIDEKKSFSKKTFYRLLTNLSLYYADSYSVTSNADLIFSQKYFIQPKLINVRPNWVNSYEYKELISRYENRILTVGRLEKQKNFEKLIKDFKNTNFEIDIVGKGSEYKLLNELSKKYNVKVNFLGQLENNELIKKYSKYKFFISSSTFEGNPKTVLEAMSNGCIVLLSDIENHRELINDNENGYIVKFNESYKQKIEDISKDFDNLIKVSKKAVVKVNKNNHIDKLVNDFYKDYEFLSSK